ncbi:MAG: hypothetical protein WB919_04005 [Candidatus Sulfotelmatobacter sp.]
MSAATQAKGGTVFDMPTNERNGLVKAVSTNAGLYLRSGRRKVIMRLQKMMKVSLVIVFLASSAFAQDPTTVATAEAACGPEGEVQFDIKTDKSQHPAPKPEPTKALVYAIEDQRQDLRPCLGNCGAITKLGLDGTWIGANRGSSYFFFSIEPGEHHLCASWEKGSRRPEERASLASFVAEAGHIYYFRVRTTEIVPAGFYSLDLEPVNSDEGQLLVAATPHSSFHQKK